MPEPVDNSLTIIKSLPELAGKKITLSYSPATAQDEAVINSYLPQPHADGSPIQPSELPSQLPAYLINVRPELRVDGQVVATGAPVGLGGINIFTMTFSDPAHGWDQIVNYLDAGVYQAIGLNLGKISQEQLTSLKAKLEATKAKLQNQDYTNLTKDDLIGDLLYTTAMAYHAELSTMNFITAMTMNLNAVTIPSETIFATKLNVMMLLGVPRYVRAGGLSMDADYVMQIAKARDGNNGTVKNYMLFSGMTSSALEHSVPEQLFSTPDSPAQGISTVKALKIANDQGIPIYTINQQNLATVLPQLQVDQYVKEDIQNAVNAGKVVTVSKTNINFNGWVGCGYIVTNPETGGGGYMISGGSSGGFGLWNVFDTLFTVLSGKADADYLERTSDWKEGGKAFRSIVRHIGILGIGIQTIMDMKELEKADSMSEWLLGFMTILSANGILLSALFLAGPASLIGAIFVGAVLSIAVNFIKGLLLYTILESSNRQQRRRWYYV